MESYNFKTKASTKFRTAVTRFQTALTRVKDNNIKMLTTTVKKLTQDNGLLLGVANGLLKNESLGKIELVLEISSYF